MDVVPKVRIPVKFWVAPVYGSPSVLVSCENVDQAVLDLLGCAGEICIVPAAGRTFYLEGFAVVLVEPLQRFNQEEVYAAPDGTTPVGVAAELYTSAHCLGDWRNAMLTMADLESPGQ
jgi:hypothetical protein